MPRPLLYPAAIAAAFLTTGLSARHSDEAAIRQTIQFYFDGGRTVDSGYVTGPDGVRLYYHRIGNGSEVVIVPGRLFLADALAPLARSHTIILYDMRNRGRSDPVADSTLITIQKDVEDLEAIRRHFGVSRFTPVGFSYLGLMVVMYAAAHPDRVARIVQLGPVPRKFGTRYPDGLAFRDPSPVPDSASAARIDSLRRTGYDRSHPREFCEESDHVYRVRLVGDSTKARRLQSPCDMPNEWPVNLERHFRHHFGGVQKLDFSREAVARVRVPVLTIHGTHDRNAPYAAGREWAMTLPDARLVTVTGAAHQVAVEAPEIVLPAIESFLAGRWPPGAERVTSIEPLQR
jgi:proline iminopeptidase